ncbi:MAG: hypothetical protein AMJ78_04585 [Omnitrophica WOR_2 bacterium SM23_29]|nr:MAG: hypothetical protein AMJ78_04585 [Omnitrophica WOR_2 bacterium SM23_29]
MQTVCFKTLGCKVNQYETQAIREQLNNLGLTETTDAADVYIINTCTVTKKSDDESKRTIRRALKSNPNAFVLVTGCYAEKDRGELSNMNGIGAIVSNVKKPSIPSILLGRDITEEDIFTFSISDFSGHTKAFVKIQDGCDRFCSFCKIPFVRGRSRSRQLKDVVEEVKRLVKRGFKEVVLTGICLGSYGRDFKDGTDLVKLIDELEKIDFNFRVRLSSVDPEDVSGELIKKFVTSKKMCRHLHIPLQSGDDNILKVMNRRYTASKFIDLVTKLKYSIKDVAITLDVMVGFPGEAEINFKNTLETVKEISPLRIHIFPYSKREGTKAAKFDDVVASDIVKERIKRLKGFQQENSYNFRKHFIGKELEVLVETKRDKSTGLLTGYSDNYIKVLFYGPDELMRDLIRVKILDVTYNFTLGRQNGD